MEPRQEPRQFARRGMQSRPTRESSPSVREQERRFQERKEERDQEFGRGRHRSPESMRSLGDRNVDAEFDSMQRRENLSMAPPPRRNRAAESFFIGGPEDLGYYDEDDDGPGLLLG